MNAEAPHYISGEEIHAGDRISYRGAFGSVAFVSTGDDGEFAPGFEDYRGHEPGIMLCDDDGALTFLTEPDEDLESLG